MKKTGAKLFEGKPPASGEGWDCISRSEIEADGGEWTVYIRPKKKLRRTDVRVVCLGEAKHKANYRLVWENGEMRDNSDLVKIQLHRPFLLQKVCEMVHEAETEQAQSAKKKINPFSGSLPNQEDRVEAGTVTFEDVSWVVSIQAQDEWANYKVRLAAQEPVTAPATYSFLWDGVKAMARFGKVKRLEKERPALYEQTIALLQEAAPRYPEAALAQRKRAVYEGNAPDPEEGWRLETTILCPEGAPWDLYVKDGKNGEDGLISAKLVARGGAAAKANFWIGWTGERYLKCRDAGLLATHFPTLYDQIEELFRGLTKVAT